MKKRVFLDLLEKQNGISPIARREIDEDLKLHPSYAQFYFDQAKKKENSKEFNLESVDFEPSILTEKAVLFLGSNLTYGFNSLGESFVDYLWHKDGLIGIKDVENNTYLTHRDSFQKGDSYIERFQNDLKLEKPDALMIEVANKDLDNDIVLGDIADKHYDTKTLVGALEYFISQTKLLWGCPIIVFIDYQKDKEKYDRLIKKVLQLRQKWGIEIIDLSHNTKIDEEPTRCQYRDIWLPIFEKKFKEMFKNG